jgi:hypothetical protein
MWFYLVAVVVLAVGVIGAFVTGGIFTIVLIPLGLIALVAAIAYRGLGHAAETRVSGGTSTDAPLPHNSPTEPGRVHTSPEELADARRGQQ